MITLAEVEYLNSCFNQGEPKGIPSEELVDVVVKTLGEFFEGFVLTVIDSKGEQYTASNVDAISGIEMINEAIDALKNAYASEGG